MNTTSSYKNVENSINPYLSAEYFCKNYENEPFISLPCNNVMDFGILDFTNEPFMSVCLKQMKDLSLPCVQNLYFSEQKHYDTDEFFTGIPLKICLDIRNMFVDGYVVQETVEFKMVKYWFRFWCSQRFGFNVKADECIILGITIHHIIQSSDVPVFVKNAYQGLVQILLTRVDPNPGRNPEEKTDFDQLSKGGLISNVPIEKLIRQIVLVFDLLKISFENKKNIDPTLIYKKFWIDVCTSFNDSIGHAQAKSMKFSKKQRNGLRNRFSGFELPFVIFGDDFPQKEIMKKIFDMERNKNRFLENENSVLENKTRRLENENQSMLKELAQLRAELDSFKNLSFARTPKKSNMTK